MTPSRFFLTIASSLDSIMEASQRNCCSLSRRAASISLGLGAIPRLFFCVISVPGHGPRGNTVALVLAQGWNLEVCFGSEAAFTAPVYDFRFPPDSGLRSDIADGPFRA